MLTMVNRLVLIYFQLYLSFYILYEVLLIKVEFMTLLILYDDIKPMILVIEIGDVLNEKSLRNL